MQRRHLFLLLVFFFARGSVLCQLTEQEASLKAAFIYNFSKYVDWSEQDNQGSFIIGIVGNSGISAPLEKIAQANTVKGKRISILHFNSAENIQYCHILFIPEKLPFPLSLILEKAGKGTLTVSEEPGYAKLGSAFNFILKNDKLKFEANLKAIYAADLKVSSQLLKLAVIID